MKRSLLFVVLCILTSCTTKGDLDGMWIGSSTEWINATDSDTTLYQNHLIANFQNDTFTFFDIRDDFMEIRNGSYNISFGKLILNNKFYAAEILSITQDSLVWKPHPQNDRIAIFEKVPQSLKYQSNYKIELEGYTYLLNHNLGIDTLFFKNDKIVEWTNNELKKDIRYQLGKIDRFYILILHDFNEIPLLITDYRDREIVLKAFIEEKSDWKLIRLEN